MAMISTRHLAQMCDRMGTSLEAGVDVVKVLDQETRRHSGSYADRIDDVQRRVSNGATLAEALRAADGYFPALFCELVAVGEQTGRLESVLHRLRDHYRHTLKLRQQFWTRLGWPIFELIMSAGVLGLLILILGLITNNQTGIFGLSGPKGLVIYVTILVGFTGAIVLGISGLYRGWFGDAPVELLMRLPVIGKSLQTMALARLAWTLSLALNAGMDAVRAIKMAVSATQSRFYTRHLSIAERKVVQGAQFHEALSSMGDFPDEFLVALENAELSGTESESLMRLSQEYQERAEASTRTLAHVAAIVIWLGIMGLLAFVIIDLVMTLYIGPIQEALEWGQ